MNPARTSTRHGVTQQQILKADDLPAPQVCQQMNHPHHRADSDEQPPKTRRRRYGGGVGVQEVSAPAACDWLPSD